MSRIGVTGLGAMGRPIAAALAGAGAGVRVFDVSAAAVDLGRPEAVGRWTVPVGGDERVAAVAADVLAPAAARVKALEGLTGRTARRHGGRAQDDAERG